MSSAAAAIALALYAPLAWEDLSPPTSLWLDVEAGATDRADGIARIERSMGKAPPSLRVHVRFPTWLLARDRDSGGILNAQLDRRGEGSGARLLLTWIVPGRMPAGAVRHFEILPAPRDAADPSPWRFEVGEEALRLSHGSRAVFSYNTRPVQPPEGGNPAVARDGYIHPAFTPSGAQVTGDYSRLTHPHHRGIFLAYTKTEYGELHPDFWNIQTGTGRIRFDGLEESVAGVVTARFRSRHCWEAAGKGGNWEPVLAERWEVEVFDVPGAPFWLIDLTSSQRAIGHPLPLPTYRYGGMAYRGPDAFQGTGVLDVLTSEGNDRVRGDQKPTRWVDLTGPVADGSDRYCGAMILDHPGNPHHPTPARIHPTRIAFFSYVPSHDTALAIPTDRDLVFRYRIVIHDGHPDPGVNELLWRGFADPPRVRQVLE